jgi:ankyrin repeat protein
VDAEEDSLEFTVRTVQLLVDRGANVNTVDNYRQTPLHLASHHHRLDCVRVFLNRGAIIEVKDNRGQTPLHRAFEPDFMTEDGVGVVQLLVERDADVNSQDYYHYHTPLHLALRHRHLKLVRVLSHGGNVNVENGEGQTPLHLMFYFSESEDRVGVVRLFVEKGAYVNPITFGITNSVSQDSTVSPRRWRECQCSGPPWAEPVAPSGSTLLRLPSLSQCCTAIGGAWHGRELTRPGSQYPITLGITASVSEVSAVSPRRWRECQCEGQPGPDPTTLGFIRSASRIGTGAPRPWCEYQCGG